MADNDRDIELEDQPAASALAEAERKESAERASALVRPDALQRYLAEIRCIPILSPEQEHALALRVRDQGDRQASSKLVRSHLRLVVVIAASYARARHNL